MRSVYFGARLHLGVNSDLAFSLPQSYCSNPLCSPTAPSSEGAEAATAAEHRFSFAVKVRCKRCHRSRIQPLSRRLFLIKGIKALVCPFAVLRSRFGLRYSRVRGRRQSKFLASSSTGGARNFYPCTGEPRSTLSSPCREQGAEGAPAPCTDLSRWHYPFKMCRDPRHT
mgnify:CR=1 FL=1